MIGLERERDTTKEGKSFFPDFCTRDCNFILYCACKLSSQPGHLVCITLMVMITKRCGGGFGGKKEIREKKRRRSKRMFLFKSQDFFSTYYQAVFQVLYVLKQILPCQQFFEVSTMTAPSYAGRERGPGRLHNLPGVSQAESVSARIRTHVVLLQRLQFSTTLPFYLSALYVNYIYLNLHLY